jgi:formylglycine-generating enzyme required for sulfatase activity
MKKIFIAVALCLAAALSLSAQAEKRIALVIGNGKYQYNTVLKNPPNDAQDMTASLKAKGFAVAGLVNATRAEMEKAIRDFGIALKDPNVVGLFFYSGHGAQAEGQNYILPVDADIQDADELRYKAVDAEAVLAKMRSAGNKLNIVILDACRNNPFPGASKSAERGLAVVKVKVPESIIVYATDPGATAADGEGRNSPFTQAFLAQMEVPGQDIAVMMKRVTSAVRSATNDAQSPWVSSNLSADFAFRPSGAASASPAPASGSVQVPSLTVEKAYGSVTIEVRTKGSLYLNGSLMGQLSPGPLARLNGIETGQASLEMRYADGKTESRQVDVAQNSVTTVAFTFVERPRVPENMVLVEGGSFKMGDAIGEGTQDERPVHTVAISGFYIGRCEVTQKEWREVMGTSPASSRGDDLPVEQVSWYDAVEYCNRLSAKNGLEPCYAVAGTSVSCDFSKNGFRLPTEAEWEFAARGGIRSAGSKFSGGNNADSIGWYAANAGGRTHPVGLKQANELGLYDMTGNVWEWCWDWSAAYSSASQADPRGSGSGESRVLRGGSWIHTEKIVRVSSRLGFAPQSGFSFVGLRVAMRGP